MTEKWEEKLWEREEKVREQVRWASTTEDYEAIVAALKADKELDSYELKHLLYAAENEKWLAEAGERYAEAELAGTREEQVMRLLEHDKCLMRKVRDRYGVVRVLRDREGRFNQFASIDCTEAGDTLISSSSDNEGFAYCVLKWFDTSDEAYTHLRKHLMRVHNLEESDWQYCTPDFAIWAWDDSQDELDEEIDENWWKRQESVPAPSAED